MLSFIAKKCKNIIILLLTLCFIVVWMSPTLMALDQEYYVAAVIISFFNVPVAVMACVWFEAVIAEYWRL